MYLFKASNYTYYTRICLPKNLRDRGFPFDLKISLLTKNRPLASERNLSVAAKLKSLINSVTNQTQVVDFQSAADLLINEVRNAFYLSAADEPQPVIPVRNSQPTVITPSHTSNPTVTTVKIISLKAALAAFIASKKLLDIRPLTIHQLESRIGDFVTWSEMENVCEITTAHALLYRDHLLTVGRSAKSNKEYLAACSQFFKHCKLMNYTSINPFTDVKTQQKTNKRPDEQRERWSKTELKKFFEDHHFQGMDEEFRWISIILLYSGMRPSEVCQLQISDIRKESGIHYFSVSEDQDGKYVKNSNSIRFVPIHSKLVDLGWLDYVKNRKVRGIKQLFSYKPQNQFDDWSKSYCGKVGKYQTLIGMEAYQRPTSYGFRHTLIDELKQKGVEEIVTAQIVGHANGGITYSRYGKRFPLAELAQAIEQIDYTLALEHVFSKKVFLNNSNI